MMVSRRLWVVTPPWLLLVTIVVAVMEVVALSGPNVCMVKQKYNITKRIMYRAPMSVRTYEWCFSMPPRCSRWNTEMRDLTRLETEERMAEVAVCCPGYKMKDVSCVPICPSGKTGSGCSEDCQPNRWGPNCVNECRNCTNGHCSPTTGQCICQTGWQGESCENIISTSTTSTTPMMNLLTTLDASTKTTKLSSTESSLVKSLINREAVTTSRSTTIMITTTPSPVIYKIEDTIERNVKLQTKLDTFLYVSPSTITSVNLNKINKNVTLDPMEIHTETKTIDTVDINHRNKFQDSITKSIETTKSTYTTTRTTTKIAQTKPVILNSTEIDVHTPSKKIIAEETTFKIIEITKSLLPKTTLAIGTTHKPETTLKMFPVTVKLKPKEIWIRPAQKEPEHITAVMSEKETERSSVDLISVISIAGGVMMAVITVAVVIVMMERCRKPRYDDIRKYNDIRMQVMIDNNDIPPPYVRSIFHTPLPDPPSEKCHYQPISTLDRNLKQFMRPVVVQSISPIMLENFRGILECHYDHLPRRNHDFEIVQKRSSEAPSIETKEQHQQRVSLTESAIDALKCEAKLDVIDSTTSEPLYAEIPCWRPPSEHAIEIINTNGEAVTEL